MRKITSGKLEIKGSSTNPKDPSKEEMREQHVSAHQVSGAVHKPPDSIVIKTFPLQDAHFPFFR